MKILSFISACAALAVLSSSAAPSQKSAAKKSKAAVPAQVENSVVKGTDGSTFGLGARALKIKGSPQELERARKKYMSGAHGPEYAQRAAKAKAAKRSVPMWERRPTYSKKKDSKLIAYAQKVVVFAKSAKSKEAFKKGVAALPGAGEGVERYNSYRAASHYLYYEVKDDPSKIWQVKALDEMVDEMKWPEEKVFYTVKYDADAPRTAEGALLKNYFSKDVDDRFGYRRTYSTLRKNLEIPNLKCNPKPSLHADTPGYEAAFKMVYDDVGVHMYIKCNNPEAWRTKLGMADGASFELTIMPGEETEWYQTFTSAAQPEDRNLIEWGQPCLGRKLTRDHVKNDSCVTDNCFVFHTVFPWIMFIKELPSDGTVWVAVVAGNWGDKSRSLGGGKAHELGRGARLVFKIDAAEAAKIREGVCRQAVGAYKKVRTDWAETGFWDDPHIGDSGFYKSVVVPYLASLDAPAEKVLRLQASAADYAEYFEKYALEWSDIRIMINRKRAEYLENRFFEGRAE